MKESLKDDLSKEFEDYSFEDDPGSKNSGYYELQASFHLMYWVTIQVVFGKKNNFD